MKHNLNKAVAAILLLLALPASAGKDESPRRRIQLLMGTVCEITAHGPSADAAISAAFDEIARWDRLLSHYKKDSELSRFNASAGKWFACSRSFWEALTASLFYARQTGGAFDPTMRAQGHALIELDRWRLRARLRQAGLAINFGGIGKGLALDRAAAAMRRQGVESALINFGGQIYALGSVPGHDGWHVRAPGLNRDLLLKDASVATSSNEEQPGHIISPFTGKPILEQYSVSVVSPSAMEADAWSTALFVYGPSASSRHDGWPAADFRKPK